MLILIAGNPSWLMREHYTIISVLSSLIVMQCSRSTTLNRDINEMSYIQCVAVFATGGTRISMSTLPQEGHRGAAFNFVFQHYNSFR